MSTTLNPCPNIVFIVAHPDDLAFSMGGTACLLNEDYHLHICCASRGERGFTDGAVHDPSAELAAIRTGEELAAAALLGAEVTFLGQIDGEIFADRAACAQVAALLAELRPRAVFTHDSYDKADHSACAQIAVQALEMAGLFWETEIYSAVGIQGGGRRGDLIDIFVNISSVIEQKRALVRCHQTQVGSEDGVSAVLSRNSVFGELAWCEYAEAYRSFLPLMGRRWNRKAGSILMELT